LREQKAQHGAFGFDELQTGISAIEQNEFNVVSQLGDLRRDEGVIHLHPDQPSAKRCARGSAQFVLAGGEED